MSSGSLVIPFPKKSSGPQKSACACIVLSSNSPSSHFTNNLVVSFHRTELNQILFYYGNMVSKGEWRDYAIDTGTHEAIFSIFRHSSEQPLYRIEKVPKLANKQGAYRIIGHEGQTLKRGKELSQVLKIFNKKLEDG